MAYEEFKRPDWVTPGTQWTPGQTQEQYQQTQVIPVSTLAGQGVVTIPEQSDPNSSSYSGVIASGASMTAPKEEGGIDPTLQSYLNSISTPPSTADAYSEAYNQSGKEAAAKQVADITAELNTITAEGQQANLKLEQGAGGKDVTTSFLGRQQQEVNRQVAIKSLPVQARLAAAQGNLNLATEKLNTLFKLKSDDATNKYDYKIKLADIFYKFATDKQKDKLDAQKTKDANDFTLMRDNIDNAQAVATSLLQSQPDLAAKISAIDWSSSTAKADFAKFQAQIKTPPDTQIVKLDNGNSILIDSLTGKTIKFLGGAAPKDEIIVPPTNASEEIKGLSSIGSLVGGFSSVNAQKMFLKNIKDLTAKGDEKGLAEKIIGQTLANIPDAETRKKATGGFLLSQQLTELQKLLDNYEAKGGKTNIFTGKIQDAQNKLGLLGDKDLAGIGVQILNQLDNLARTRTGAVISPSEEKLYARLLPSTGKVKELNDATITALKTSLMTDVENNLKYNLTTDGVNMLKGTLPEVFDYNDTFLDSFSPYNTNKNQDNKSFFSGF